MGADQRKGAAFRVYRATSPSHEALVLLASDITDAVDLAVQFQTLRGLGEVKFAIDPGWHATLSGIGRDHIEEAREMCDQPSLATRYRADTGWALGGPELDVNYDH